MERIGLYNIIKTVDGLPEKIKQKYGKPYSSVSTSELIVFLKKEGYINKESLKMNGEYVKPKTTTKKEENSKKEESKPDTKVAEMTSDEKLTQRINEGRKLANEIALKKAIRDKFVRQLEALNSEDSDNISLYIANGTKEVFHYNENGRISQESYFSTERNIECQNKVNNKSYFESIILFRNRDSETCINIENLLKDTSKIKEAYITLYNEKIQNIEKEISELELKFKEL